MEDGRSQGGAKEEEKKAQANYVKTEKSREKRREKWGSNEGKGDGGEEREWNREEEKMTQVELR